MNCPKCTKKLKCPKCWLKDLKVNVRGTIVPIKEFTEALKSQIKHKS